MGHMIDSWGHAEANPLGVSVFSHSFDDAIRTVELSKEVRQKVYTGFESKVVPLFRKFYITTTKLLEDSGLFPDLDDDYVSQDKPEPEPVEADSESIEEENEVEEEQVEEEVEEEAPEQVEAEEQEEGEEEEFKSLEHELKEELRRRREERKAQRGARGAQRGIPRPSRGQVQRNAPVRQQAMRDDSGARQMRQRPTTQHQPARDVGEAISNIYGTVRELMQDDYYEEDDYEYDDAHVEIDEVVGLLQQLQNGRRETGGRIPVRQQLMDQSVVDGRMRRLAPEAAQGIEVVESLVDTIERDELLPEGVKDWVRELELTLDKVATKQTDFLSQSNPHKSVEVINQLARLGGAESGSVKRNVDEIIDSINQGFDSDPEVFNQAYDQLQPLVDRQNRAFTGNVLRTVKASEGQQTLQNAQRAVVSEMDNRLSGKEVPEILMKLLMPGWRNLMVNTHLRQGEDSGDWRKHVQAMEQLFEHLDEDVDPSQSADYMPPEALLEHIEGGLDSISYEPGQRVQLINSLREILTSEDGARGLPTVNITESVAESLGLGEVDKKQSRRQEIIEEKSDDEKWAKFRERASLLHVGDWVEFIKEGSDPEIGIVAWASEESGQLVFVNRRGVKLQELTVEDLASLLTDGAARILEEADIPLTDRASHKMLQDMHNQLTHQATHDELTKLPNRKEFERELELALDSAKRF
jgi:hypothetical protein